MNQKYFAFELENGKRDEKKGRVRVGVIMARNFKIFCFYPPPPAPLPLEAVS